MPLPIKNAGTETDHRHTEYQTYKREVASATQILAPVGIAQNRGETY